MSASRPDKVAGLVLWLERNAFWNSDLLDIKESKLGGVGVFWSLGPQNDPENDNLLLRIPKLAVLSPKNSFIYSLLVDHQASSPTFDFTQGMHSLVLAFIYERAAKEQSPWHLYFESFSQDPSAIPICLWSEREKKLLHNSECDLLGMLDASELASFYLECVAFAKEIETVVPIPEVLKPSLDEENETAAKASLLRFGNCVQNVISRAFTVDKYYGLSLVPGADLFNHLSPLLQDNIPKGRENVHFVCDDDDNLCAECGEIGCSHLDEAESEAEDLETEEVETEYNQQGGQDGENEELSDDGNRSGASPESDSESEVSDDNQELTQDAEKDETVEEAMECEELTMAMVEELENEDAETDLDDGEVSTLSLSENEDQDDVDEEASGDMDEEEDFDEEALRANNNQADLAAELQDGTKCCDIVLTRPAEAIHDYELFNTYGNRLSNPYLLQRYGFICPENPNLACNLTIPMFAHLKKERANPKKKKQLQSKINWYEEVGFELVNEICAEACQTHEHAHGDKHEHDHDHDGGCCDEGEESDDESESSDIAESWPLSPRIGSDGKPTLQTVALIQLLIMPFKTFQNELLHARSERKLEKRVSKSLVHSELSGEGNEILKTWVIERLRRYKDTPAIEGSRAKVINTLIQEEKRHLLKALSFLK